MGAYALRRLLQMIPVIIGTTFLIFVTVWALPGDPFRGKCGDRACPPEYVAQMREQFHLDDPLLVQYGRYLGNLLTGDLGQTFSGDSVASQIGQSLPVTLKLTIMAIGFEVVIGIAAGILSALRRGKFIDNLILVSTLVVISIPVFVIGFVAQYMLAIQWKIFPATVGPDATPYELLLPALVLASLSLAYVSRLTRDTLSENLRADYVRTATAKGVPRGKVVRRHALRNSLIPVVTFIGADFGALMGGAIITEGIFNINGIGGLTYRAIRTREGALVVAVVTFMVLIFLLANLLVDLLYGYLDPRIRYE